MWPAGRGHFAWGGHFVTCILPSGLGSRWSLESLWLFRWGCWLRLFVFVVRGFVVGDVLAVVDDARGGVELFVVGVFDDGAEMDVLREVAVAAGEVQVALGLGVGGEPVFAVDLLVVGGVGRG